MHYCAEQFENDGSPMATMFKGFKRAMAGEYSRGLSSKVFAGQCRLIEKSFRQGGPAGFGLLRLLIDQHGAPKATLTQGEHKSLQTDRVVLVPGPEEEVAIVREIYRAFVSGGQNEAQIADGLNDRGILTDLGRLWTRGSVHQLLINEKYIGTNVWNRVSFKLKKKRVRNDPETWIRTPNSFPAIVDPTLHDAANKIIAARSARMSDEEMLAALQSLLEHQGALSGLIIDEADETLSSSAYSHRFGSLLRAYRLVGFRPRRDYRYIEINRELRRLHPEVIDEVISGIPAAGGVATRDATTDLVAVNGEFTLSLVIVRCTRTQAGSLRWRVRFDTGLVPDISVVIRMDELNRKPFDYFLFPLLDIGTGRLRLRGQSVDEMGGYVPLGYDVRDRKLVVNEDEAATVRGIFERFVEVGSATVLARELRRKGLRNKQGTLVDKGYLYRVLMNRVYRGDAIHKGKAYPGEHQAIIDQQLWDQVHAILRQNPRKRANNTRAQAPALLKGLIFTATGAAMTPSSAKKGAQRYRYYVSMDVIKNCEPSDAGIPRRLPADLVEAAVVTELRRVMRAPSITAQVIAHLAREGHAFAEADVISALQTFEDVWAQLFPAEQTRIVQLLVRRVTVTSEGLVIDVRTDGVSGVMRDMMAPRKKVAAE